MRTVHRAMLVSAVSLAMVIGGSITVPALAVAAAKPGVPATGSAGLADRAAHGLSTPTAATFVPGHHQATTSHPASTPLVAAAPAAAAHWPAAGTAAVDLAGTGTARAASATTATPWATAATLPISIAAVPSTGTHAMAASVAVSKLTIRMAAHPAATAAGVNGVLFSLARADAVNAAGPVQVRVNDASFAHAYGGGYASRLALVTMPACALTTPSVAACRATTPLPTDNDAAAQTLTAQASVASADGAALVVAATATTSGGTGDFKASSLAPSAAWQVGTQTGDFSWSYPLRMPPPIGGTAPELSLSYDSGAADGETAQDNAQPGQLGEGFGLTGGGYVERKYAACADHVGDASNTTNQKSKTGDLCWDGDNAYLVLDGHASELIQDAASNTWHLGTDDGSTVKELTGAANGAYNGQYWEVIAPDGTQYYFGENQLPGYASGDVASNSVWTVPVVGLKTGDPCHSATYTSAVCANMPWRWNLDLSVDANGNATEYFYNPLVNYYAFGTTASGAGTKKQYDAGGTLAEIDYGSQSPNVYNRRPIQVTFAYVDRCTSTNQSTCASNENGTYWPDVPWDLDCTSSATCTGSGHEAPAFFDTQMLSTITTSVYEGSPGNVAVDTWKLGYTWLAAEVNSDLFLSSITRTGDVGGSSSLGAVTFGAVGEINRVPGDGYPAMTRYRVASITTESGAQIDVTYNPPDCGSTRPDPGSDTLPCFQQKWSPGDLGDALTTSWFYKYTVHEVDVVDGTGGEPDMPTVYTYVGGAAWHYDTNIDLVPVKDRTYAQWRGYAKVDVVTGAAGDQSETDTTFLRGMDHDPIQPAGGFSSATVTDSRGDPAITDADADNGFQLEQITYDGLSTQAQVSDVVAKPWISAATATSVTQAWGAPMSAVLTGTAQTDTYAPLAGGGTRHTEVQNTMNATTGLVTQVSDLGDVSVPGQATCTTNSYAQNAAKGILDDQSEVKVTAGACGTSSPALVSDTRFDYDNGAFGTAPSAGDVTETDVYSSGDPGVADHWVARSRDTYDSYGRVLSVKNAANNTTSTTYTSAYGTGRATTQTVVTDALGHTTTTTLNPAWGLPTQVTDSAGGITSSSYDPLGRISAVWRPGESESAGNPASFTYSYSETATKPSAVTTKTLINAPSKLYTTTISLFDSELRARQDQTAAEGTAGGTEVTDVFYDSRGNTIIENGPYPANTTPSATLWITSEPEVPNETATTYDGDNRRTAVATDSDGTQQWKDTYSYPGVDATTEIPPLGGTVTTTYTDARGNTIALDQYHNPTAATGTYDATTYTYTPANKLATISDAAGNHWSNTYDTLGRTVATSTPDAGTSTSGYNDLGLITSQTDARGKTVSFIYDNDQRKTAEYDTTGGAGETTSDEVAAWTYDTSRVGQLASATTYVGGTTGEAYQQAITGYTADGKPTTVTYTIPSSTVTGSLAGSYTFTTSYNANDSINSQSYPAAGGLPAETVDSGYNNLGSPYSLFSPLSDYVMQSFYAPNGQPQEVDLGTSQSAQWSRILDTYDTATDRLATSQVQQESTSWGDVTNIGYVYGSAGDVTSVKDTADGDDQCFTYDYDQRLSSAWSQSGATCPGSAPGPGGIGGPAPYQQVLTYDSAGLGIITSDALSTPSGTSSTTMAYPAAGSARPHADTSATTTGLGAASTTQTWNADGQLATATTGATALTYTWNDQDELATIQTGSTVTTAFRYDTDGNQLVRQDGGTSTLFLPGEELVATGATVTGTRYYTHNDTVVAARTASGLTWLAADPHGTNDVAINSSTQAVTERRYLPFGGTRGTQPSSWPGDKGFVGGTVDAVSSLTNLGAREYQSAAGTFISADPLISPYNPQDLDAYAYAANNPVTNSDPTGQMFVSDGGGCVGSIQYCEGHQPSTGGGHGSGGGGYTGGYGGGFGSPAPYLPSYHPPLNLFTYISPPPPPKPVERPARRPATPTLPACVSGRMAALNGGCSMPVQHFGKGSPIFGEIGHWIVAHRTMIADVTAMGVCFSGVGTAFCVAAQAVAYGIRAQARIEAVGFRNSVKDNLVDAGVSAWSFSIGSTGEDSFAEATEDVPMNRWAKTAIKASFSIPDYINEIGGHLPGHDPVFFP